MNLVLIGMMGCGKSTCGRLLAQHLNLELVDMDTVIQQQEGRSISQIFTTDGEDYFRDLETALAQELSKQDGLIISTGGGVILRSKNVEALRKNSMVVWLNRSAEHIFDGVSLDDRPLAQDGKSAFLERFAQRESKYRAAAHVIVENFSSPEATVRCILSHWNCVAEQS